MYTYTGGERPPASRRPSFPYTACRRRRGGRAGAGIGGAAAVGVATAAVARWCGARRGKR